MSDWLHNLPVAWMALVVFGLTYLVAAAIYAVVTVLAVGERARSFKAVSPGMLPPLGIIFGLFSTHDLYRHHHSQRESHWQSRVLRNDPH
jgi:hypothetical protein